MGNPMIHDDSDIRLEYHNENLPFLGIVVSEVVS